MSRFQISSVHLLGLIAMILMTLSMFFPWWSLIMMETKQTDVYPHLINGPITEFIGYKRSPQMTLLTGVLCLSILLTLIGSVVNGIFSRISLFIGGTFSLLGAWRLIARVAGVAAQFDIPVQGSGRATYGGFAQIEVASLIRPGVYLIISGGILAILAAILNRLFRIGGKSRPNEN